MSIAKQYAAVLKESTEEGVADRVIARMKKKGHLSLLPEVVRILEREDVDDQTLVFIAKEADKNRVGEAVQAVGGDESRTKVKVDPKIVGGYVARNKGTLRDSSIRKSLVTIYQRAVGQI